jgi:hypothetical protein
MLNTFHLELGKRWKINFFYIEMIIILFLHKNHIEIVQLPHVLYAKNVQEKYLEEIAQI